MFALTGIQTARLVLAVLIVGTALVLLRAALRGRNARRQATAAYSYLFQRGLAGRPDMVALTIRLQAVVYAVRKWFGFGLLVVAGNVLAFWTYLPGKTLLEFVVPLMTPMLTLVAVAENRALRRIAPPADAPHVAHGARATIEDYVPPVLRWWPAITVVVSGAVIAVYVLAPPVGAQTGPGVVVVGWLIAAPVMICNVPVARRLVARPQPAASPDELAVRNELTGDTVGALLGFSPVAYLLIGLSSSAVVNFAEPIGLALIAVPALLEARRRRWVRERLWTPRPPHPPMPMAGS